MTKTIPKKKKFKKAKWFSEEALQTTEKRPAKGQGERERYAHLNEEFQRIARRDKKAFLNKQSKNRGKTRDLFEKIGDAKGLFHARKDTIKDGNSRTYQKQMRLRRGGNNTQNHIKKGIKKFKKIFKGSQ